jgi:hypothetical protein
MFSKDAEFDNDPCHYERLGCLSAFPYLVLALTARTDVSLTVYVAGTVRRFRPHKPGAGPSKTVAISQGAHNQGAAASDMVAEVAHAAHAYCGGGFAGGSRPFVHYARMPPHVRKD